MSTLKLKKNFYRPKESRDVFAIDIEKNYFIWCICIWWKQRKRSKIFYENDKEMIIKLGYYLLKFREWLDITIYTKNPLHEPYNQRYRIANNT